jgi:hypothetical protein
MQNGETTKMLSYLASKAIKAGYQARITGDTVTVRLPFTVYGHGTDYAYIKVKNFAEYTALIGSN